MLLSGRGEPLAVVAEEALRAAAPGVALSLVRSAFFSQNFGEGDLLGGVLEGELVFPAGATAEPFVDADDLADVVVALLTGDGPDEGVHELTGPRPLTFDEVASMIAEATGREVRYVPVTGPQYAAALVEYGVPEGEAGFLAELFSTLLDGHNAATTDGVKRVLGREPKDFGTYVRETAGGSAWRV